MPFSRMDLDDVGSPMALVGKILRLEPTLAPPIPVEELAYKLDIGEINELTTEGFEGGLLTDEVRSFGGILVRRGMDRRRRRFTIGHELGHFLMPFHKPARAGQFLCSRSDMAQWSMSEQNRAARMEAEANLFAATLLMPAPFLRPFLQKSGDPDIAQILTLAQTFDVSKEAAARSYVQYLGQPIAVVVAQHGSIARFYKATSFPRFAVQRGQKLPTIVAIQSAGKEVGELGNMKEVSPENWLESQWGRRQPELLQQVLLQSQGFVMVLLWAEEQPEDEFDPDEDRTAKERLRDRESRWN